MDAGPISKFPDKPFRSWKALVYFVKNQGELTAPEKSIDGVNCEREHLDIKDCHEPVCFEEF